MTQKKPLTMWVSHHPISAFLCWSLNHIPLGQEDRSPLLRWSGISSQTDSKPCFKEAAQLLNAMSKGCKSLPSPRTEHSKVVSSPSQFTQPVGELPWCNRWSSNLSTWRLEPGSVAFWCANLWNQLSQVWSTMKQCRAKSKQWNVCPVASWGALTWPWFVTASRSIIEMSPEVEIHRSPNRKIMIPVNLLTKKWHRKCMCSILVDRFWKLYHVLV